MIVTICKYEHKANAPFMYKVCIRNIKNNLVYQSNNISDITDMLEMLYINILDVPHTTKQHRNYNSELICTQTIYFIKEM